MELEPNMANPKIDGTTSTVTYSLILKIQEKIDRQNRLEKFHINLMGWRTRDKRKRHRTKCGERRNARENYKYEIHFKEVTT